MSNSISHAPVWMFSLGYFFGLSLAGAAIIRAAALKLKKTMNPKVVDFLLLLHLVPIFLGIQFAVHGLTGDCQIIDSSASLTMIMGSGGILSGCISLLASKKLKLKII